MIKVEYLAQRSWREVNNKDQWQLKQWKAYLLAGLEAFADVQPCSMKDFYFVERRHMTEATKAELDTLRLLRLHHGKIVATSSGGLIIFSSILNKLP